MLKNKAFLYVCSFLLFIGIVHAATIHGTVYDISLKKANNARVEINTSPKQFLVAQNGTYSFTVPNGLYTIKAQLMQKNEVVSSVQENITIKHDGSYVLDLILFPDFEEGVEDPGIDINGSIMDADVNRSYVLGGILILIVMAVAAVFYYFKLKSKGSKAETEPNKESFESNDLDRVIDVIKKDGGRTTQKEIRKQIPLSEAKISLMIAELEHKGVIEKIKKGRGNIIILKK